VGEFSCKPLSLFACQLAKLKNGPVQQNSLLISLLVWDFAVETGSTRSASVTDKIRLRPLAQSDGHDVPELVGELVPGFAAEVDEIVVGFEDATEEPTAPFANTPVKYGTFLSPKR
jgi:hypothetical protein